MKTVITIENNPIGGSKVTVQVDDNQPVHVQEPPTSLFGVPVAVSKSVPDGAIAVIPTNSHSSHDPTVSQSVSQSVAKESRAQGSTKPVRSVDTPSKQSRVSDKKVAGKKMKRCEFCGDDISHLPGNNRKACLKPECAKAQKKQYMDRWLAKQPKKAAKSKSGPIPQQEATPAPVTPQFMPGHEKTPEEIEAWRPKPFNLPESTPSLGAARLEQLTSDFTDPWNCEACRRRDHLCPLHQSMSDDGSVPPSKSKGRPPQQ